MVTLAYEEFLYVYVRSGNKMSVPAAWLDMRDTWEETMIPDCKLNYDRENTKDKME